MYKSYYKLDKKPFKISSDPNFMWLGEKHKEALATLKYGILDNKGFLLLTGDVGTGKTTLINALIKSLSNDIVCTSVPDPGLEKLDFFNYIATSFGMKDDFSSKGAFLVHFKKFLLQANHEGKKVLLIIDEAQLLTQELLEEIRLLSNIEKTDTKLINIFFIGQNEFNEILNQQHNRAVRQRLTLNYNIDPLTPDETSEYIRHRLKIAGTNEPIFDSSATQEVFMYSGGFPRRINIICDHCLLSGYVKEKKIITADIVKECGRELKIPERVRNRDINGIATSHNRPATIAIKPQTNPETYAVQPQETQKDKNLFNVVLGAIFFFAILLFFWFYILPGNFSGFVSQAPQKKLDSKLPIVQKPSKMSGPIDSSPAPEKAPIENHELIKKKVVQQTTPPQSKPIVSEIKSIEKIVPIQEDLTPKKNEPPVVEPQKKTLLPTKPIVIRFKYNTNDYTKEGYKKLVDFSNALIAHPETKIIISGYTDSNGYKQYNIKLSEFRANIVRSFFLGRGIQPDQIITKGFGSQNPIEPNNTAWGRMMNRRVEIKILN